MRRRTRPASPVADRRRYQGPSAWGNAPSRVGRPQPPDLVPTRIEVAAPVGGPPPRIVRAIRKAVAEGASSVAEVVPEPIRESIEAILRNEIRKALCRMSVALDAQEAAKQEAVHRYARSYMSDAADAAIKRKAIASPTIESGFREALGSLPSRLRDDPCSTSRRNGRRRRAHAGGLHGSAWQGALQSTRPTAGERLLVDHRLAGRHTGQAHLKQPSSRAKRPRVRRGAEVGALAASPG